MRYNGGELGREVRERREEEETRRRGEGEGEKKRDGKKGWSEGEDGVINRSSECKEERQI